MDPPVKYQVTEEKKPVEKEEEEDEKALSCGFIVTVYLFLVEQNANLEIHLSYWPGGACRFPAEGSLYDFALPSATPAGGDTQMRERLLKPGRR